MPVTNYDTVNGKIRTKWTGERPGSQAVFHDPLGSVVGIYEDGWLKADRVYDASGETRAEWNDVGTFGWVGGYGYRETRREWVSHYVRARHYSYMTGGWTSVDPLWPSEMAYGYVDGKPTAFADPDGTSCRDGRSPECMPDALSLALQCSKCEPIITCFRPWSKAEVTAILPEKGGTCSVGTLKLTIAYYIRYTGEDCPPPTITIKRISVNFLTGQKNLNYYGGWCKTGGPIPPSSSVSDQYVLYTDCLQGDPGGSMTQGSESFKFRIGTHSNRNPIWYPTDCGGKERAALLVHPEGGPFSTLGCIGVQGESANRAVRSCLQYAGEYGCSHIPLSVTYFKR